MSLKHNLLSTAVRVSLTAAAVGLFSIAAAPAYAQSADAEDEEAVLETIQVTGTRIKSQSVTASAPVVEIQREAFQFTGATRVDDLVNQYPQMSPYFDSFANNGAQGYPTVDLRGLGPLRTLALVNGRRLPPGDVTGAAAATDISIIPAALVRRVDILTGGASAVYGSDAMAGVVNFVLDTEFEGFTATAGYSAYQHDNNNDYIQGLMDARGFEYPEGDSGFDGISRNIDLAWGGQFADGAGHATAWVTWRENDALFQGQRDYSSCALNAAGTACGGSATAGEANFLIYDYDFNPVAQASLNPDGSWVGALNTYNYAPINYYQRPDERRTMGASLNFEVNEFFKPYAEVMYINRRNSTQIAESGTFFGQLLQMNCNDPLLGTACSDLGLDDSAGPLNVYVGKRNVEGGPRIYNSSNDTYRFVAGAAGAINDYWSYDVSYLYGANHATFIGENDFLSTRITDALLGCQDGSFAGCLPYNVWVPGGVTTAAAQALAGVSANDINTAQTVVNGFVTGDLGFGLPWANGETISLVAGAEYRKDEYDRKVDTNTQEGNFAGAGGPTLPITGLIEVTELFMESEIPLLTDAGFLDRLSLDLGYRYSDYEISGSTDTYKIGFGADMGNYRVRGGYNRAIRAPNVGEFFAASGQTLWSGSDPCSGASPLYTAEQCARTGVTAEQYGNVSASPASQYNQLSGGNLLLQPEVGDTYTLGFVAQPMENLQFTVDYYDIQIEDAIDTIGARVIIDACALNNVLCDLINRHQSGALWIGNDPATSGHVVNTIGNFGEQHFRGVDLGVNYGMDMLGGRLNMAFQGSYSLEREYNPIPGVEDLVYDCAGLINESCEAHEWRHIANVHFSRDWYNINLRWRYLGEMDYTLTNGNAGSVDQLLVGNDGRVGSYSYLDLSGSVYVGQNTELTVGVNNIADKEPPMVGADVAPLNGNAPSSYDQAGRYFFGSVTVNF